MADARRHVSTNGDFPANMMNTETGLSGQTYDITAAQSMFNSNGLDNMSYVEAPDGLFDLTAPW